jgi:hypothetical protein
MTEFGLRGKRYYYDFDTKIGEQTPLFEPVQEPQQDRPFLTSRLEDHWNNPWYPNEGKSAQEVADKMASKIASTVSPGKLWVLDPKNGKLHAFQLKAIAEPIEP